MLYTSGKFNDALHRNKARNKKRGYSSSITDKWNIENKVASGKWFVTCRKKSHLMAM